MRAIIYKGLETKPSEELKLKEGKLAPQLKHLGDHIAISGGQKCGKNYCVKKNDIITVRVYAGAPVAIVIAIIAVPFVVVGIVKLVNLYQDLKKLSQRKTINRKVESLPYLGGAENQLATGQTQPMIIGEHLFTPYFIDYPLSRISGTDGRDQFTYRVYELGFKEQVIKEIKAGKASLKKFVDSEPQEGKFNLDATSSLYDADAFFEITQGGEFLTEEFNKKYYHLESGAVLPKKKDGVQGELNFELPANSKYIEVAILFNGLIGYSDDGSKTSRSVEIIPQYSLDGSSWETFSFDGATNNVFTRITQEQIRFTARKTFTYAEIKNQTEIIKVRLLCPTVASTKQGYDDCYCVYVQSELFNVEDSKKQNNFVAEKRLPDKQRALSTRLGLKIKATEDNQDKLGQINVITQGIAPTPAGNWINKTPTSNPASWLYEILTSETHPLSAISKDEIDLASFTDLFYYCDDEGLDVNAVLLEARPKQQVLEMVLRLCNSVLYRNMTGQLQVATDKLNSQPIALFTSQNVLSTTIDKNLERKTDGVLINYIDSSLGYEQASHLVMHQGETETPDSVISTVQTEGITNHEQVVKFGRRLMATETLRPKTVKVQTSLEGVFYTPMSKVLLQTETLKTGKGNGEIKKVILDDNDLITHLELYDNFEFAENETNIIVVSMTRVDGNFTHTVANFEIASAEGKLIELATPISSSHVNAPKKGDTLAYGVATEPIISEMIIAGVEENANGYTLTLVDYNEAIYDTGDIPVYKPSWASDIGDKPPATLPPLTMDELQEVKNQSQVVILELSTPSVTRGRQNILEPDRITASARKRGGDFEGLFVLEATHDYLHWQTVAESSEPESSREFNLPVTIPVDDEQHFAVSFRVSVREALETIIDDETVYSTGDLFAQKDIAVVLNADARPIYWGARDTYPVGNLQVGDFYFDTNTQELDGGVLRVWTGSAWVLFNPNDSTYANAFNIAVTDIMVWVREHGVENFVAINAIFESIGASRAFITVLEAHELKLTGTFSGGRTQIKDVIVSIQESLGVVDSSFHGTGKNDLSVVEESAEKGFVEVKVLSPEVGDQTPFGGTIFDTSGKEIHSDRLQEQDWNVAKSWAEETRNGKAWRLPTRAELSLINPVGAFWTGETSGDEVYLWEGGNSNLANKQGFMDIDSFFNASRYRYTIQLVGTKIYIPEYRGTALEIIDTTNNTVTTYANFFNTSRYRRTSQIVEDKIYVLGGRGTALEIIDTTTDTVTTLDNFFSASRERYTSQLVGTKIYIPELLGIGLEIIDTTNNTVTTIDDFFDASRWRHTSHLVGTKIYIPQSSGTALEIIDTTTDTVTTLDNFFSASRERYTSQLVGTKIYIPQHLGIGLEIIDTTNNTVTTIDDFFNASRYRYTSQPVDTKIYIPQSNGIGLEIIDTTNNTVTTIDDFFDASRWRHTSHLVGTKIYIPQSNGTGLEIIHTANTLPVRNNTETQRRQVSSSSDGTTWTIRSNELITAGQTFTSYFGLKLRFAGDTHKVGDYWRYEQDEMGAFSLQDSSGEEYVRAMNGKLWVKEFVNTTIYDTYSTAEHRIGTWIDGKPIYRKVINFGTLPNNSRKDVAHGISDLDKTIRLYGTATSSTVTLPLPNASPYQEDAVALGSFSKSNVTIRTGSDRTTLTAIVFIEHTKTTD